MKFKSIKNKILFYYSILLVVIFLIFSTSLYFAIKYSLEDSITKKLHIAEEEISYFINDELELLEEYKRKNNRNYMYDEDPDIIVFDKKTKEYKVNTLKEIVLKDIYLEIRNRHTDETIVKSINMKDNRFNFDENIGKDETKLIIDFISVDHESIYKIENKNKKYSIHIATSLKETQDQLLNVLYIIIFFSIVLFIITFVLASYLIQKTINPMKEILSSAKELKAHDLSKRLSVSKSNDEFEELGNTFNDMFDEIEDSFIKLKKFNSDASHELKTPLTIISGEIEVLLKKERTNEEYKTSLVSIFEETQNLKDIVNILLTLTSTNDKQIKKDFKKQDINDILLKVYEEYFFIAQKRNIVLDIESIHISTLYCDEILIRSMFTNLIDNAIKFSKENTRIIVDLKDKQQEVIFKIIDEGIGIQDKQKELIFDRFYRADESHNKKIKGYGLGLSIVKNIINLHNGEINIYDNKPNGSIFEIKIRK